MAIAWMNPKAIKFVTIHCAATPRGRNVTAETISKWDQDKFGQTSYHYVIELDGTVKQTLRHDQRGAHTGGANTGNIGICYVGGVENDKAMTPADTRTDGQKKAMAELVKKLRAEFPAVVVRGHRDWPGVKKACPSFDVATWLKSVV
ncbi:MAG TPA: N-acetylmuramoyl-L-alanine amidase [Candidatus Sphingomonas excrementigallinarum]|nr:N-acetylmuramoyl-L-alanine amidase [Candidatus Sphingomonas excrementigallinarum]